GGPPAWRQAEDQGRARSRRLGRYARRRDLRCAGRVGGRAARLRHSRRRAGRGRLDRHGLFFRLERDELVAFYAHAEVRQARLLDVGIAEGIAEWGKRDHDGTTVRIDDRGGAVGAVQKERAAPLGLAPRLLAAVGEILAELLWRRVVPHPLHRRARRSGEKQERDQPAHAVWTARIGCVFAA